MPSGKVPPPRDVPHGGDWPNAIFDTSTPLGSAATVVQEVARRLGEVVGSEHFSVRSVGEAAEVDFTILWPIVRGEQWISTLTLFKLEAALGKALVPPWRQRSPS